MCRSILLSYLFSLFTKTTTEKGKIKEKKILKKSKEKEKKDNSPPSWLVVILSVRGCWACDALFTAGRPQMRLQIDRPELQGNHHRVAPRQYGVIFETV